MTDEEIIKGLDLACSSITGSFMWTAYPFPILRDYIHRLQSENAALRERLEKAVVFPIKFGDKIYTINFQKPKAQWSVHCGVVKTISVTQTPDKSQLVFRVKIKYRDAREYVLGKSAFLSKEAAESRLEEIRKDD